MLIFDADVYSWAAGELGWFCHWLACRDQSVLLILDNLDVEDERRDVQLSAILDQMVLGCSRLTLLITARRPFYRGRHGNGHVTIRVGDLRQSADQMFLQVKLSAQSVAPERIWKWGEGEHRSGACRQKLFLVVPVHFLASKSTISRFGERFHDGQYSLVSFLFAVLLYSRCPRAQPFVKVGARAPPCAVESVPLRAIEMKL